MNVDSRKGMRLIFFTTDQPSNVLRSMPWEHKWHKEDYSWLYVTTGGVRLIPQWTEGLLVEDVANIDINGNLIPQSESFHPFHGVSWWPVAEEYSKYYAETRAWNENFNK